MPDAAAHDPCTPDNVDIGCHAERPEAHGSFIGTGGLRRGQLPSGRGYRVPAADLLASKPERIHLLQQHYARTPTCGRPTSKPQDVATTN